MKVPALACGGRNPDGTGDVCGARYNDGCMCCSATVCIPCPAPLVDAADVAFMVPFARSAGWRVGPARPDGSYDVMCPACAKPDPGLVRLCKELSASTDRSGRGAGRSGSGLPGTDQAPLF